MVGDGDDELWLRVARERRRTLLAERFGGDAGTVERYLEWLEQQGIPFEFHTWA